MNLEYFMIPKKCSKNTYYGSIKFLLDFMAMCLITASLYYICCRRRKWEIHRHNQYWIKMNYFL